MHSDTQYSQYTGDKSKGNSSWLILVKASSEKMILDDILSDVIKKNISGTQAAEITHKEILAWKIAYERKPNSKINYADEFIGLDSKSEAEMTIPELNFIKYRDFANA